jgi:diguanylate cyclase (GGDEF)-like protein/PAS domain S-box-containing protein
MEGIASLIASAFDNLRTFEHVQQSKEYMQAILQSAKDLAIISTDLNGYVITVSLGCESIFHRPQQQILGRDIVTLFSSERFQQEFAAFLSDSNTCMMERSRLIQTAGKGHAYLDILLQRVYSVDNRPIGFLCVCRDVTDTVLMQQRLEALSVTDDLTGLYNQRRFYTVLASEIERSRRFNRTFSLCFIDLDGLKQFNDRRGHVRGDRALRETASLLRTLIRKNVDSCFRYGGDEFTIIMPETTRVEAQLVIERILARVSEQFGGEITLSGGIVEFSATMQPEVLIEKADLAMYRAKSEGGNRVLLAD